jgi:lipopolysaccharide export LptBFGC system permease protein LptF
MSVLDRYVFRSLAVDYAIALGVMICLYVLLDLFVNMDEFTEHGYSVLTVLGNVFSYYAPQTFVYFAQLCGVITLFACMATIVRMRRMNELTALLASGISLYRIAAPVVAFGILTTGLLILDTEWIIPAVAHKLVRDRDDVDGRRAYEVLFLPDRQGALLSAGRFHPSTLDMRQLLVLSRNEEGTLVQTLEADRATWRPPAYPGASGSWQLERGRKRLRSWSGGGTLGPQESIQESFPTSYESDLSPQEVQLRQAEGWIRFLSLRQLRQLDAEQIGRPDEVRRTQHGRIAAPILSLVMLLLGLPFFLDRSPTTVLSDTARCLVVCGACYVTTFIGQNVHLEFHTALPYWIPIFLFGTLAMVLLDRIRT